MKSAYKIKKFFSYYKPHLVLFIGDMIAATLIAAIDVAFPIVSKWIIDEIIPSGNMKLFGILISCIFIGFLLRKFCTRFVAYWGHVFGTYVETDMRSDIFAHLEKQSFSFFDKNRTGKLMSRVTTDLFEVTELAHHGPEDVWTGFLTIVGACILLTKIRIELSVIVFFFSVLIIFIVVKSKKSLMISSRAVKEATSEINANLESSISGIRVTQIFTNEKFEIERFGASNQLFRNAKKRFYKAMSSFLSNIEFSTCLLSLIVLASGGYFIIKGKMVLSDLIAANLFVATFAVPIRKLSNFVEQFTTGMAGFTRFLEIMNEDTFIKDDEDAVELLSSRGNISFKNVDFAYNENQDVLRNVNLDIFSGQKFAFVGSSGGGKTTICSLLPRFYEISKGFISLDGIDIHKIKLSSLRKQIGIVQQDVFLFAGTIRDNIEYGKPGASMDEIVKAAKRAEIYDDIMKMEKGFDTVVGERGIKLSGGQKQRISIARCFLKNPPILILDEATSALDTATEMKIQHSFDELSKGRTTLVIAHRLSTIKNADCIAVIDNHTVVEIGSHEELMKNEGMYKKLHDSQFC